MDKLLVIPIIATIFLFHRLVGRFHQTQYGLLVKNIAAVASFILLFLYFAGAVYGYNRVSCISFFIFIFASWPCMAFEGKVKATEVHCNS